MSDERKEPEAVLCQCKTEWMRCPRCGGYRVDVLPDAGAPTVAWRYRYRGGSGKMLPWVLTTSKPEPFLDDVGAEVEALGVIPAKYTVTLQRAASVDDLIDAMLRPFGCEHNPPENYCGEECDDGYDCKMKRDK